MVVLVGDGPGPPEPCCIAGCKEEATDRLVPRSRYVTFTDPLSFCRPHARLIAHGMITRVAYSTESYDGFEFTVEPRPEVLARR